MKRHTLLLATLLTPFTTTAQNHLQLGSGLTISNSNLFSQQTALPQNNNIIEQRLGLQFSLAGHWQQLNNQGGLTASAYAYQDWGLTKQDTNIQQLDIQGQKLLALNASWLSRTQLNGSYYDNQQRPANSYQSLGINQTLGYFSKSNSGLDLNVAIQHRTYQQNPTGTSSGQQFELGSVYYFASPLNNPRWAAAFTFQQFNASDTFYNSRSQQLNLSYGQWLWQKWQGNVSLQWMQNRYPNTRGQLSETYRLLSIDALYPLTTRWQVSTTLSSGSYQTSIGNNRAVLNAYLGLQMEL